VYGVAPRLPLFAAVPAVSVCGLRWLTFPLASLLLLGMACLCADAQQLQTRVGASDVPGNEKRHDVGKGTQHSTALHNSPRGDGPQRKETLRTTQQQSRPKIN
jgi:hypothetical protein